jgi:hypothetical protein
MGARPGVGRNQSGACRPGGRHTGPSLKAGSPGILRERSERGRRPRYKGTKPRVACSVNHGTNLSKPAGAARRMVLAPAAGLDRHRLHSWPCRVARRQRAGRFPCEPGGDSAERRVAPFDMTVRKA